MPKFFSEEKNNRKNKITVTNFKKYFYCPHGNFQLCSQQQFFLKTFFKILILDIYKCPFSISQKKFWEFLFIFL